METKNLPENRKFGFLFAFIFILLSIYTNIKNYAYLYQITFLFIGLIILLCAIFIPKYLKYLNILWFKFGIGLGKIISPIILGIIFFFLLSPISIITRKFDRDILKIKKKNLNSYWLEKKPKIINYESFKDQF